MGQAVGIFGQLVGMLGSALGGICRVVERSGEGFDLHLWHVCAGWDACELCGGI